MTYTFTVAQHVVNTAKNERRIVVLCTPDDPDREPTLRGATWGLDVPEAAACADLQGRLDQEFHRPAVHAAGVGEPL